MKKVIVVPTYNEKKNIADLVPLLFKYVPDAYVLVVDDNSPDGTAGVVEGMQNTYKNLSILKRAGKEGLGKAYIHAFREVLKDPSVGFVVMMDADFSHNPEYLPEMFRLAEKNDVVIGSRYIKGGFTTGWELWRRALSRGGNIYCRSITRMPIMDCTGGFNIMRASILRKIDFDRLHLSGYAFVMELKHTLYRAGAKFAEYPIVFANRKEGESKMSSHIIREGVLAPWKLILKK
ncbi:MAG: polyprenol monophosphomannose synthase [Candidatus Paceibacterota bacterium]|jgi:dolichol-phosphate mannosyltransferase